MTWSQKRGPGVFCPVWLWLSCVYCREICRLKLRFVLFVFPVDSAVSGAAFCAISAFLQKHPLLLSQKRGLNFATEQFFTKVHLHSVLQKRNLDFGTFESEGLDLNFGANVSWDLNSKPLDFKSLQL